MNEKVVELRAWAVVSTIVDPYAAPEVCGTSIEAAAYGHPRFEEGERIRTGRITRVVGRDVWTDRSHYRLVGKPHGKYVEWLASKGLPPPSEAEPIRMKNAPCPPPTFNPWNEESTP